MRQAIVRFFVSIIARTLFRIKFKVRIEGKENLPKNGPLLLISNHFTWFEAPLLIAFLPYHPSFVAAIEMRRFWWFRLGEYTHDLVPIWRGQVDRQAMRRISDLLKNGRIVGIFPEGGVNPQLQEAIARGEQVTTASGNLVRDPLELVQARPGTAFLALQNNVPILPVAVIGTEVTEGALKLRPRVPVTIRIGKPFGPLTLDSSLKGQAKRERLDELGQEMMLELAQLFPQENQGIFREMLEEKENNIRLERLRSISPTHR